MTTTTLTIEPVYFGFADIGHGGYTAGLIAEQLSPLNADALEAKFVAPPPLGVPLTLVEDEEAATLSDGDQVIVEVRATVLETELPALPSLGEATTASAAYAGFTSHPAPMCMTCGPDRDPGAGLRVFVGPVEGRELVAGAWTPNAAFTDTEGFVFPRFVWASLDCPSYWAIASAHPDMGRVVTARLSADLRRPVPAGEPLVVIGWPLPKRGTRLFRSGAAIFTPGGQALAVAEATWINADG